ncbi:murein DD-endopeptidase / murein LD-carboxypeptidase [Burkholderiales bacterium]|nr:murein DD-endopeptidase / murein LD-carboxypeptidase [Burkholderiales bacterium]
MPGFPKRAASLVALAPLALALAAPPARALDGADAAFAPRARAGVERAWHDAQDVAIFALGLIGVSYRYGSESPERGLDCSGLVRHAFQQVTGVTLPRTSKAMSGVGEPVAHADLAPGDLVFFDTRRFAYSHVGIYLGEGRFVHAPARGRAVQVAEIDNAYWRKHFNGARRLVGVLPGLVPEARAASVAAAAAARR